LTFYDAALFPYEVIEPGFKKNGITIDRAELPPHFWLSIAGWRLK
jgi:hypothetical protein